MACASEDVPSLKKEIDSFKDDPFYSKFIPYYH